MDFSRIGVSQMKKKSILILSTLLIASILAIIPTSAKVEFKANGKITHYLPEVTSSAVVHGRWDVKIKDGEVEFKGYYTELNIEEEVEQSPPGTVDHFRLRFTDQYMYSIDDGVVTIWGTIHYDKKYWAVEGNTWDIDPPGKAPVDWVEDFIVAWVKIEINSNAGEFKMDTYPIGNPPNGWNLFGNVQ